MTSGAERAASVAEALRRAFDLSFAGARSSDSHAPEHFLAITVAGRPYALRLTDVAGLHADHRIVPVPSPAPALLGIASFRGTFAPVYDLCRALGHTPGAACRWLVLVRVPDLVGLAFDSFESHFTSEDVSPHGSGERGGGATLCIVHAGAVQRPLIDVASAVNTVVSGAPRAGSTKER